MADRTRSRLDPFSTDILNGYKFTKFWHEFEDQDLNDEYYMFWLISYRCCMAADQSNLILGSIVQWMTDGVSDTGFFVCCFLNIVLFVLMFFVWRTDLSIL